MCQCLLRTRTKNRLSQLFRRLHFHKITTRDKLLIGFVLVALAAAFMSSKTDLNTSKIKRTQVTQAAQQKDLVRQQRSIVKQIAKTKAVFKESSAALAASVAAEFKAQSASNRTTNLVKCFTKKTAGAFLHCLGLQPGAPGQPGSPGIAGTPGRPGQATQGLQGLIGALGPRGPPGVNGVDSEIPGPKGDTGTAGADGATGATGADSTVAGPQGGVGANGADGATGPVGATGATGADGATGPAGPQGPQGANAATFTISFTDGTGVTHTCTIDPTIGPNVTQACT
jgi:hypothetical protein